MLMETLFWKMIQMMRISQEELILLEEDNWVQPIKPISRRRTRATFLQPMVEEILEKGRKRKADEKVQAPKRQKTAPNSLKCNICDVKFNMNDNLARHLKNKH